jgi:hypothetical protein
MHASQRWRQHGIGSDHDFAEASLPDPAMMPAPGWVDPRSYASHDDSIRDTARL